MYIGEFCKLTQTTPKTIRYYESINILPSAQRIGKYRVYDKTYVETVRQIKLAQEIGFTLAEIKAWCKGENIKKGLPAIVIQQAISDKKSDIELDIKRLNEKLKLVDEIGQELKNSTCRLDSSL